MSDTEDSKVLGKRTRNGQQADETLVDAETKKEDPNGMDEDSDDDVGPMPMPAGQENGGVKKKRKGAHLLSQSVCA